jgi:hypothetical protein
MNDKQLQALVSGFQRGPTIGRKRRRRRARGRKIEARKKDVFLRPVYVWTPAKIDNLTCWHSADHPLVQDGRVVGLQDLSGHGRHMLLDSGEPVY